MLLDDGEIEEITNNNGTLNDTKVCDVSEESSSSLAAGELPFGEVKRRQDLLEFHEKNHETIRLEREKIDPLELIAGLKEKKTYVEDVSEGDETKEKEGQTKENEISCEEYEDDGDAEADLNFEANH